MNWSICSKLILHSTGSEAVLEVVEDLCIQPRWVERLEIGPAAITPQNERSGNRGYPTSHSQPGFRNRRKWGSHKPQAYRLGNAIRCPDPSRHRRWREPPYTVELQWGEVPSSLETSLVWAQESVRGKWEFWDSASSDLTDAIRNFSLGWTGELHNGRIVEIHVQMRSLSSQKRPMPKGESDISSWFLCRV